MALHETGAGYTLCKRALWQGNAAWQRCAVQEIAELKMPDLNCMNVEAAMRIVEGTAKNMGVKTETAAA